MSQRTNTERINVAGDQVLRVVKRVVHEGNVRRVIVRNDRGEVLVQLPLTVGVVGVAIAPLASVIGAVVTVATHHAIAIEHVAQPETRAVPPGGEDPGNEGTDTSSAKSSMGNSSLASLDAQSGQSAAGESGSDA